MARFGGKENSAKRGPVPRNVTEWAISPSRRYSAATANGTSDELGLSQVDHKDFGCVVLCFRIYVVEEHQTNRSARVMIVVSNKTQQASANGVSVKENGSVYGQISAPCAKNRHCPFESS